VAIKSIALADGGNKSKTFGFRPFSSLQCTDDDNRSYRNVYNVSLISFSSLVVFKLIEMRFVSCFFVRYFSLVAESTGQMRLAQVTEISACKTGARPDVEPVVSAVEPSSEVHQEGLPDGATTSQSDAVGRDDGEKKAEPSVEGNGEFWQQSYSWNLSITLQ